jgi:UDP-N-acetylglucosamine 2-epimerase (non-hydrolysing)
VKVSIILGTRPEIVKFSPIMRDCERLSLNYFILHTGQHYSYSMDRVFFEQLELPSAKYNLDVGSGLHGKQTGTMLAGIEEILMRESPDVVLVQGDTNTVLAGALAASKLGIKVGHVEAGLRSYDRRMPEETNRVLADHCSDYLFAPTPKSKEILLHEGILEKQIFMVGNTAVDAVYQNLKIAKSKNQILTELGISAGKFMLATSHRQENVDNKERFASLIKGLQLVQSEFGVPLIYSIHPRARKQLELFGIDTEGLTLVSLWII